MRTRRLLAALVAAVACGTWSATASASLNVEYACNGSSTCEGVWFTAPVLLNWTVTDATSWSPGCVDETIKDDTAGVAKRCTAWNGPATFDVPLTIKLDQKPPTVNVVPDRPPDHAGWYTRPVAFAVTGIDETSGLDRCDPLSYGGPDVGSATITATCRDRAGNVGTRGYQLNYDAAPPDPNSAAVTTGDRVIRLSWPAGPTASVTRTPGINGEAGSVIYEGAGSGFVDLKVRNGRQYRYVLTLTDQAGNAASRELSAKPQRKLLTPARRAVVPGPPLLTWTPVRGARYYNVQLFRDGRKILSTWPRRASLQLEKKWRFRGRRFRLKPAEYRWHVWPGEGRLAAQRYGKRIGRGSFTVAP